MKRHSGFTLIELLVVLAIMGLALAAVSLSLRDNAQDLLERDAQRLVAQLEKARALSRTTQQTWVWQAVEGGYLLQSVAPSADAAVQPSPIRWSSPNTIATASRNPVLLGPEPVIGPARIELRLSDRPRVLIPIVTDGVASFEVQR